MPLREYLCDSCCHQFDEFVTSTESYQTFECRCGAMAKVLPSIIGGYSGNMGPSSTRPKRSTSGTKGKAFTGNKETYGAIKENAEGQLEFDFTKKES